MTAEAPSPPVRGTGRPWRRLRRLSSRTSLRVRLIATLTTLVILALVVISCVGTSILRGYLLGQTDQLLQSGGVQHTAALAVAGSPNATASMEQSGFTVWWLPEGGSLQQVVQPGGMALGTTPDSGISTLPKTVISALAGPSELTTTVAGQVPGDRWRVTGFQASLNGTNGTVILGTDVSSVYTTIQRLTGVDLIVSLVIVVVLLLAGIAMVRASLRPLTDIEETAGEIADGHLNRRVPERDPRTEIGSLGRSLNIMLSQIEAAFHSREESEAAAHQSEERMRRFIADASHELRTPLTAIRGFAEYYRQRGGLARRWDRDEAPAAAALAAAAAGSCRTTWTGSCSGWKRKRPGWGCWSRTCCCWPGWISSGRWPTSRSTCSSWPPTRFTTPGCSPRPGPSSCQSSLARRSWSPGTSRGCGRSSGT